MSRWPVVALADIATLSSGGTPSKARPDFWEGEIPWVSPKDMKSAHIEEAEDHITREAIAASAAKTVTTNSILAVVRSGILAHTFPVATVGREVAFNQDIKAITSKGANVLPSLLFWFFKAREVEILRVGVKKGATVHSLANGFLERLRFPLPPLDEQRRIVALLDRAAEIRRRAVPPVPKPAPSSPPCSSTPPAIQQQIRKAGGPYYSRRLCKIFDTAPTRNVLMREPMVWFPFSGFPTSSTRPYPGGI